jgi:hypothetical protein
VTGHKVGNAKITVKKAGDKKATIQLHFYQKAKVSKNNAVSGTTLAITPENLAGTYKYRYVDVEKLGGTIYDSTALNKKDSITTKFDVNGTFNIKVSAYDYATPVYPVDQSYAFMQPHGKFNTDSAKGKYTLTQAANGQSKLDMGDGDVSVVTKLTTKTLILTEDGVDSYYDRV